MTMILTYDDVFSRVQILVTGLSASVDTVKIERSTNQINWVTVRGGESLSPLGNTVFLDDYEFTANVVNYYRATGLQESGPTFIGAGTPAHADNANVTPSLPASIQEGDLLLVLAAARNGPGQSVPNPPSGYTLLRDASNLRLFGKIATNSEVAPTITFSVPATGATRSAQMAAFRGCSTVVGASTVSFNGFAATQNINYPATALPQRQRSLGLYLGWRRDDWDNVSTVAGAVEIGDVSTTVGDDQAFVWNYEVLDGTALLINSGTFIVTGGTPSVNIGVTMTLNAVSQQISTETESITPTIDAVWLKNVPRPFLNRTLDCVPNQSPIRRKARNGIFPVVGRSFPIAVTDVKLSREVTIEVITRTTEEHEELDIVLASGDIFFLQTPPGNSLPTMYVVIGDTEARRPLRSQDCGNDWRVFLLPMTEVAAPSSNVVGLLSTYQTVVNTYATYADVLAAHSTYLDLLSLPTDVDEVIVP